MRRLIPLIAVIAACYTPPDAPATPSVWQVTGDGQSGVPGYRLPAKIVVHVLDADGRPIMGDTLDITPSDQLAVVEPGGPAVTDSTGAVAVYWRLGSTLGSQTLAIRSRLPGIGAQTVTATSRSNNVQSIAEAGDNGMCAVDQQGRFGCWLPPQVYSADLHSQFVPVSASVHFTQVAMLSSAARTFNAFTTNSRGCVLADTGRPWCFALDSVANVVGLAELPGTYPAFAQLFSGGWGGAAYCGLTAAGEAWCWGGNSGGQLGDGTTADHAVPAPAATTTRFVRLDMSARGACGLTTDGAAWCWGANGFAAGVNGNGIVSTPVAVNTAIRFQNIRSIGQVDESCGLATIGGMYCWGSDFFGQTARQTATPVAMTLSPAGADAFEGGGLVMLFDQRANIDWGGDPNQTIIGDRGGVSFPERFPLSGLLSDIRLAHGYRYGCGTAAIGSATLCLSTDGLFFLTLSGRNGAYPTVLGVPFPQ